jgi:gamma-glutamyl-gamma-aminobutyrate hydrolase PuuD
MKFTNKTVYIEQGNHQYTMLFIKLGFLVTNEVDKADLVCFTGGADVSPVLYKDAAHAMTHYDHWRDSKEQRLFETCKEKGLPMVGICRGGQFLNVMSGGRMYQHVSRHTGSHHLTDLQTGDVIYVTSTHHQMMMPGKDALLVASANLGGTREWLDGVVERRDVSGEDIEVVYYPETNCLCFQPHPEFTAPGYENMFNYFGSCLSNYLIKERVNDQDSSTVQP